MLLLGTALSACSASPDPTPSPSAPLPTAATATAPALPGVDCTASLRTGPLPVWARGGFSDQGASFRHVEGLHGRVVGVLFGYPLSSPPRPDRANKILWVAQEHGTGRLVVSARLDGTGPPVVREVGFGGGQSVVDLPAPGCWRATVTWGDDLTDVVDLPYVPGRSGR